MKIVGKKGYAYLFISIMILVVLMLVFLTTNAKENRNEQEVKAARIKAMNDFVKGFNQDIERATQISAFRTLLALEDWTASNGVFLENISASFKETFYNGTIQGVNVTLMTNSSFNNYLERVNQIANRVGIKANITVLNINLQHSSPWNIDVTINMLINITDSMKISSWEYQKEFSADLNINNLRDPIYGVFTNNKIPNTIRQFNESTLVTSNNDTNNLLKLINDSYYIASSNAPNFLMRFENKTGPDPHGIESLVNLKTLSDQDIEVFTNRIKVDYIYFNNITENKICNVQNVPSEYNFVITPNRVNLYQIDGLSYQSSSCP